MAQLQIGSFVFAFKDVKTMHFETVPVYDPSGCDIECTKVHLEIMGLVHPVAIATAAALATPIGGPGTPGPLSIGDRLPFTMANLRDLLMQPRQQVTFTVGGTVVLQSYPTPLPGAPAGSTCDVRGGPIVEDARYTEITGDKSAILHVRLYTHVTGLAFYMLSNRWSITARIDSNHLTTRTIHGRVKFNKNFLDNNPGVPPFPLQPDDFRSAVVPPAGIGMQRDTIDVVQNEAGDELMYTATDQEVIRGTGANSQIVRIECMPTVGVDVPIKDAKTILEKAGVILTSGLKDWKLIGKTIWAAIPTTKAFGHCRVFGAPNSSLQNLVTAGINVLLDRLGPSRTFLGAQVSCFVTTNCDTHNAPWAEVRMEFVGLNKNQLRALLSGNPTSLMSTSAYVFNPDATILAGWSYSGSGTAVGGGGPIKLVMDAASAAVTLSTSNNTRGTWLQRLVAQVLLSPGVGLPGPLPNPGVVSVEPGIS